MYNLDFLIKHALPTQPDVEKETPVAIHTLLDGRYYSVNNKRVFLHETDVSDNSPKGLAQAIDIPVISDLIYRWAGINVSADLAPEKILFIDTETTGLSIGTGTYAFLVGLGFFNNNRFIIRQYFMTDLSGEAALVRILTDEIRRFDLIVSFNGKSYDIPLLNTRFIFHGSGFAMREMDHLDLLPLSRRFWRDVLPGCSLQQLEQYVIRTGRMFESDIPSHLIPQMYFDFLRTANAAPLLNIFYHNKIDIISMVLLLNRILSILESPIQSGIRSQVSLRGIARFFHEQGNMDGAIDLYRFCIDQNIEAKHCARELSFIYKRNGQFDRAVDLWKTAVDQDEVYACIELAKVAEHRDKNYLKAKELTRKALDIETGCVIKNHRMIAELNHRLRRLESKLLKLQA